MDDQDPEEPRGNDNSNEEYASNIAEDKEEIPGDDGQDGKLRSEDDRKPAARQEGLAGDGEAMGGSKDSKQPPSDSPGTKGESNVATGRMSASRKRFQSSNPRGRRARASRSSARQKDDSMAKEKEKVRRQMGAAVPARSPASAIRMSVENEKEPSQPLPGDGMDESASTVRGSSRAAADPKRVARQASAASAASASSMALSNTSNRTTSSSKGTVDRSGPQPGAFRINRRARGGVPAWIMRQRQQQAANRGGSSAEISQLGNSSSSVPPELRSVNPELVEANNNIENAEADDLVGLEESVAHPSDGGVATLTADCRTSSIVRAPDDRIDPAKTTPKRRIYIAGAVVLLVIVVAVAVGVVLATSGGGGGSNNGADVQVPNDDFGPAACMVRELYEKCQQGILVPLNCASDEYNDLRAWVPTVDSNFDDENSSCAPTNLALYALAQVISEAEIDPEWRLARYVLGVFYFSTNGPRWRVTENWLTSQSVCNWFGIVCKGGVIESIGFERNKLAGMIPTHLSLLSSLVSLVLPGEEQGKLRGTIPSEILDLNLNQLNLAGNDMDGSLPPELGNIPHLQFLLLGGNKLTGGIPSALGQAQILEKFEVDRNQLTGTLPSEMNRLTKLSNLLLYGNLLTGTLPPIFGGMDKLTKLAIADNMLSGSLPFDVGIPSLVEVDVSCNRFNSTLPSSLGRMHQLTSLKLEDNRFSGNLPTELGQLSELTEFFLEGNRFIGLIPNEVCMLVTNASLPRVGRPAPPCNQKLFGGLRCPNVACCPDCPNLAVGNSSP